MEFYLLFCITASHFASLFSSKQRELFLEQNTAQDPVFLGYLIFTRTLVNIQCPCFECLRKKENSSHEYIFGLAFLAKQS